LSRQVVSQIDRQEGSAQDKRWLFY